MRILNITNQLPYPPISGAPLRTHNILRRLAKDNDVYLVAFSEDQEGDGAAHLLEFCREVVTVRPRHLKEALRFGKLLAAMFQGEPPELRLAFSQELAKEIQRLTDKIDFDAVMIEHGSMGMYWEVLPDRLRRRSAWVLHDIDFDKFRRIAGIERTQGRKVRAWMHGKMMRKWQPQFANGFGLCVTMSEADRQVLLSANGSLTVVVSPNGVDTSQYHPLPEEDHTSDMLFIGNMGYEPNVDAACYFCYDVLPLVRKSVNGARLWIVGINPSSSVRELEGENVVVTGRVSDVVPYYRRSKISVVPLRAGSGTRLKILEAMALGRPVVSTSKGCEGLGAVDGKHILIADDKQLFAEHVVKLLTRRDLRASVAAKAREFAVASYDWDEVSKRLIEDFEAVIGTQSGGAWPTSRHTAECCRPIQ